MSDKKEGKPPGKLPGRKKMEKKADKAPEKEKVEKKVEKEMEKDPDKAVEKVPTERATANAPEASEGTVGNGAPREGAVASGGEEEFVVEPMELPPFEIIVGWVPAAVLPHLCSGSLGFRRPGYSCLHTQRTTNDWPQFVTVDYWTERLSSPFNRNISVNKV